MGGVDVGDLGALGSLPHPLPPPPPRGADTHVAEEAAGRQRAVGHLVGAGVSELKGDARVPPAPELAGVDDAGLRGGGRGDSVTPVVGPQPALLRPSSGPRPLTPRSCSFMCRSQSLTPRRAS